MIIEINQNKLNEHADLEGELTRHLTSEKLQKYGAIFTLGLTASLTAYAKIDFQPDNQNYFAIAFIISGCVALIGCLEDYPKTKEAIQKVRSKLIYNEASLNDYELKLLEQKGTLSQPYDNIKSLRDKFFTEDKENIKKTSL